MPVGVLSSLLTIVIAALLAGCGSDDVALPEESAADLLAQVQEIEATIADGNCNVVETQAMQFATAVDGLPSSVDGEVRSGLEKAASRLVDLSQDPDQCEDTSEGATGVGGVQTTETDAADAETQPDPETTAPETETTEEPEEEQPSTDEPSESETGSGQPPEVPGGGQGGQSGTIEPDTGGISGGGGGP
jgi:hypothetical protein